MIDKVPCHIGIIMDGNRRWAESWGLPGIEGHRRGAKKVRQIVEWCRKRGVKILTLYAFSEENWSRSPEEVDLIMGLFEEYLIKEAEELRKNKVKLLVIGRLERLPVSLQEKIKEVENLTKDFGETTLVLAISYGGRDEIATALKRMIREGISPEDVSEEKIGEYLYTAGLPDPDLIIRTSGEMRTSGFLLWQSAYSELYFTEKYWPNFSEGDLDKAVEEYGKRQRRFGK